MKHFIDTTGAEGVDHRDDLACTGARGHSQSSLFAVARHRRKVYLHASRYKGWVCHIRNRNVICAAKAN